MTGKKHDKTQKPFVSYNLEEERSKDDITFTTRLTKKDMEWFEVAKKLINQPKNSTAMKQLATIGYYVVAHDSKISKIFEIISGNLRRNERIGVTEKEYKVKI